MKSPFHPDYLSIISILAIVLICAGGIYLYFSFFLDLDTVNYFRASFILVAGLCILYRCGRNH